MNLLHLKLVFNVITIHCLLKTAFTLKFACVDSQRGDIMGNNNADNNLWVIIKKNVQSETPLYE